MDEGVAFTVKHFANQGRARSLSYKILKNFQGRNEQKERLKVVETSKNCVSQAKLAQTFSVNFKPYVQKVLKEERCKCYKKQKVPEWSEKKKSRQKRCSKDKDEAPPNVRYSQKKKFQPKLLVWLAVRKNGHSEPFFERSKDNVNGSVFCAV